MSEGPNENCESYENYGNYETGENLQDLSGTERELRELQNCENSQKYQEWFTSCQRDPTRTANFTKITSITKTATIRKISEGPNEIYENYENCEISQGYQEWLMRCQGDPYTLEKLKIYMHM